MPGIDEKNTYRLLADQASKSDRLWISAPWITLSEMPRFIKGKKDVRILVKQENAAKTITDWNIVEELSKTPNTKVKTHPRLHAKIWLFDYSAYVGSSNPTPTGLGQHHNANVEYGIITRDPREVDDVEKKFLNVWQSPEAVDFTATPNPLRDLIISLMKATAITAAALVGIMLLAGLAILLLILHAWGVF